jgi:polysaccharide export outer membrane protein
MIPTPWCLRYLTRAGVGVVCLILAGHALTAQPYLVGQGDVLKVAVWSQPELSGEFTVDATGGIVLPLVGAVKAAGLPLEQIERDIRDRLADGYVVNPQVAISVTQFKSQRVFVIGEVKLPGVVPLTGALTLVEALTRVGSLTEMAGGDLVVIRPPDGQPVNGPVLPSDAGARELLRVDVRLLQSKGPTSNIVLKDGDTVVVPRAEVVYVIGQVNTPGAFAYERDMSILQVISKANGVNDVGTTKRLKILRIVNGKRTEVKASLGDKLQPGDTVVVASRWF